MISFIVTKVKINITNPPPVIFKFIKNKNKNRILEEIYSSNKLNTDKNGKRFCKHHTFSKKRIE